MAAPAAPRPSAGTGRVMVFARCRPPLEREAGDHDVVVMDSENKKSTIRIEEGDSLATALAGELGRSVAFRRVAAPPAPPPVALLR